ncbi:MAG: DMT family transporter [Flavisolibacter sp.]|nr:DMT family transporter [Flavisolibacter sp.]
MAEAHKQDRKAMMQGVLYALLAALLWSGNFIVARGMHQKIGPVSLAFFRWLTATVFLFPVAQKAFFKEWRLVRPHWKYISITALLGITFFNTFVYVAGRYSSAINLALIGTTAAPLFVLLISVLFLKEKVAMRQFIGALLCVIGILLLISKGSWQQLAAFRIGTGDVWILTAALSFALYTLLVRRKPRTISSLTFLFSIFFTGTLFLIPAYIWEQVSGSTFNWTVDLVLIFLYLGIGASVLAFLLWNTSIHKIGATHTALFGNLIPVFSMVEAVWLLHEQLDWVILVSFFIVIAGLVIANARLFKKR